MDSLTLAYVLVALGLLILAAELFVPSGGLLFVLAICALVAGIWMIFQQDPRAGWVTLLAVLILVPILGGVLFHYWPRTPMGRRFTLRGPDEDATVATMPTNLELEQLRGRVGRAIAPLRPAGVADFDGKRIDVLTEGMMVEPGTWLRVIDVRAGKVIVRAIDKPDLKEFENLDLG